MAAAAPTAVVDTPPVAKRQERTPTRPLSPWLRHSAAAAAVSAVANTKDGQGMLRRWESLACSFQLEMNEAVVGKRRPTFHERQR